VELHIVIGNSLKVDEYPCGSYLLQGWI